MLNFKSKHLSISDEPFGCTITFSDTVEKGYSNEINMDEKYLMLQRTYGEDEFENGYYTIELSDFEQSKDLEEFRIDLNRNLFKMEWDSNKAEIELCIDDEEFVKLKEALKTITNNRGRGQLIIY